MAEKFETGRYFFGVGEFQVSVITPPVKYRLFTEAEREASKTKNKRNDKDGAVQGAFYMLEEFKSWAEPSFSKRWEEHRAFYEHEQLLYFDLGEFAHHLVELLKANRTEEFPAVFETIERMHLEGDQYVKQAAAIGMLEGIQNVASNSGVEPQAFVEYLKPESVKWWRQLNDFWEAKIPYEDGTVDEA